MTIGLILSLVISAAIGVLLLRLVWPRAAAACPWPLAVALGAGLGAGLSAVLLFLWMLLFGPGRGFVLAEVCVLGLMALGTLGGRRPAAGTHLARSGSRSSAQWHRLIVAAFLVTLCAATAAFLTTLRQHPHGEWDAWMNWDLRARMIFRGGSAWRTAFSATFPWSHPDYPVLVPSLVVRNWLYAGKETLLGPALVAAAFTFGTVALLVTAIATLRSLTQGLLAGLVLLSTPFFIVHGTSLYADVPVGFFFLTTIVCLALDGRYGSDTGRFALLAGAAAGLAMWTKNEGLLFTLAVGAGLGFAGTREGWAATRRRLLAFAAGFLPMLLLTAGFKIAFAPPNDLLSTLGIERTVSQLTDPDRYFLVLRAYAKHILTFGSNGFGSSIWVLTALLLVNGVSSPEVSRSWVRAATAAVVLLLAGHFMVFVSMAHELQRLLNSSLDRLLLQLWPSALFVSFVVLSMPGEKIAGSRSTP